MTESKILTLYKNLGETPLACIERFRADNPEYRDTNMTYLGRLDPMAEGLLLVLAGNTRNKKEFLDWDKTYEFEVLWGFETDTYDTLGLVEYTGPMPEKLDLKMQKLIETISKKKTQEYPTFSSKMFRGNFLNARVKTDELDTSTRGIKIFSIEHTNTKMISKEELMSELERRIALVKGDFRQEEILGKWRRAIELQAEANHVHDYLISGFCADVSSGTYIRSLAHEMGRMLDTAACAFSIKRTRVGEYRL